MNPSNKYFDHTKASAFILVLACLLLVNCNDGKSRHAEPSKKEMESFLNAISPPEIEVLDISHKSFIDPINKSGRVSVRFTSKLKSPTFHQLDREEFWTAIELHGLTRREYVEYIERQRGYRHILGVPQTPAVHRILIDKGAEMIEHHEMHTELSVDGWRFSRIGIGSKFGGRHNPQNGSALLNSDEFLEIINSVRRDQEAISSGKQSPAGNATDHALLVEVTNKLRLILFALIGFEDEFGTFPGQQTIAQVIEKTGTTARAESSNDCFAQIVAVEIADSEDLFSIQIPSSKQGEKPTKHTFAYIDNLSLSSHAGSPVVLAPLLNGKTIFDQQAFGGRAVVAFVDGSVRSLKIEADGRVLIDGKDLFDPTQPFWGGKAPTVKWPSRGS